MPADFTVQSIHIYPVKALRGISVQRSTVEPWGLTHDRRWMVVRPDGQFLTQRELPGMARVEARVLHSGLALSLGSEPDIEIGFPSAHAAHRTVVVWNDEVPALEAGDAASSWLSTALGLECSLVYLDDTSARPVDPAYSEPGDRAAFSDGFPVLLANEASLQALNAALPQPLPMSRFRPNIVVAGAEAWAEDRWRLVRIGTATFRVAKPCARCIVTTVDQEMGTRPDKTEPLKTLGRLRRAPGGVMFGQNLIPDGPGAIAIGDRVELLEVGESNVDLRSAEGQTE
jgi:uncharacterized protein YcbX